ncbi:hypothetical protein C8D90_101634 [Enterobacillus tribolii]|uniref:Uncharacterized protein n=1 Tax=Enterobacillus tribolii TaxID=1487935 RepID=A0A370R444_9GAMM|nr:hypothetical protein C8D90_101634 [Enterobacillus tribolii]
MITLQYVIHPHGVPALARQVCGQNGDLQPAERQRRLFRFLWRGYCRVATLFVLIFSLACLPEHRSQ